jgi:hypothetical protein
MTFLLCDAAASGFNRCTRAFGNQQSLQFNYTRNFTAQKYFSGQRAGSYQTSLLKSQQINTVNWQLLQV